jgi:N-acetylglutamate synthase-like GNAT family acetyltransferase
MSATTIDTIMLRGAQCAHVADIAALINGFASERLMLPRSPESIALALGDFVVAAEGRGRVLACGALKEYSPSLAEIASLAVAREAHGQGLGRVIIQSLESIALARGIGELFALTLAPSFFETLGYDLTERARYPEKIHRDCLRCMFRSACREACVSKRIASEG